MAQRNIPWSSAPEFVSNINDLLQASLSLCTQVQDQHPRKRNHRLRLRNGEHKKTIGLLSQKNTLHTAVRICAWISAISNLGERIQTNVPM